MLLRPLRLTLRRGYESGRQNLKLKRNTLLFMKVAHQWEFRVDMNKNGLICVTIVEKSET